MPVHIWPFVSAIIINVLCLLSTLQKSIQLSVNYSTGFYTTCDIVHGAGQSLSDEGTGTLSGHQLPQLPTTQFQLQISSNFTGISERVHKSRFIGQALALLAVSVVTVLTLSTMVSDYHTDIYCRVV